MEISYSNITEEPAIPSVASGSSLSGLLYAFGNKLKRELAVCTPAIVCQYDQQTGTAIVRPLVAEKTPMGQKRIATMVRVSVIQHQSGGFFMNQPLFVGDTGFI